MKTEELTALGLNEDQVKQVFALNGKDVEAAKAAKDKTSQKEKRGAREKAPKQEKARDRTKGEGN